MGLDKETINAYRKSYELTDETFNGEGDLINGLIYYGELDKAQTLLSKRPVSFYLFQRSYLNAAKGEISKIDTAFSKATRILLMLNQKKILKDLIPRIEKVFDQRKIGDAFGWNYDVLKNLSVYKQYQEDPDFKKLLIKAKMIQDEYLEKYGNLTNLE